MALTKDGLKAHKRFVEMDAALDSFIEQQKQSPVTGTLTPREIGLIERTWWAAMEIAGID